jgi:hypothetical protein
MKRRLHKRSLRRTKGSKRRAKKTIEKVKKFLSDNNPAYLKDKDSLLKLLQGNKKDIPSLFYDVEKYLKSKKKRDEVFEVCIMYVNKKIKRNDVIYLLEYQEPSGHKGTRWWPFKK